MADKNRNIMPLNTLHRQNLLGYWLALLFLHKTTTTGT